MINIYFKNEESTSTIRLYHMKGGFVYYWLPASAARGRKYGAWRVSHMTSSDFIDKVNSGRLVRATKWMQRIYALPKGNHITVPSCYSLRALVAKYPPQTIITFGS